MAKRIIQQARGHGSGTYRVRRKAFRFEVRYPSKLSGEGTVLRLLNSPAHTAPLAKVKHSHGIFFMPAFDGMVEGQKLIFGTDVKEGSITKLKDIPIKTKVYCIESRPGDGGVFVKTAGSYGVVEKIVGSNIHVMMPSKKEKAFNGDCRAVIGAIAGAGRLDKPLLKAGKVHHMKSARGKLWPRTSAVKMNVIDHPFGSGRGKNPKSKIAKRNAPAGKRVGHIRPKRTGHKK